MIEPNKLSPFRHFCMTIGAIPSSYKESLTYYEMLEWLCKYLQDTVIPAVNNNAEALEELQTAFVTLKDYVDHYFDDLDIQTEINAKLDEMAESGELADIIAQYLQLSGVLAYDSVADLKTATNLVNGSFAETYGYYNYKDGGGALYKIRDVINTDVPDDVTIIALADENLVAELLINELNVKQFGAKGDGETDDTEAIQKAFDYLRTYPRADKDYSTLYFPEGEYIVSDTLTYTNGRYTKIYGKATIKANMNKPILDINSCMWLYVDDLLLIQENTGSNSGCIKIRNSYILKFNEVYTSGGDKGVDVVGNNITFDACSFRNSRINFYTTSQGNNTQNTLINCAIELATEYNLYFGWSSSYYGLWVVENCYVEGNCTSQVYVENGIRVFIKESYLNQTGSNVVFTTAGTIPKLHLYVTNCQISSTGYVFKETGSGRYVSAFVNNNDITGTLYNTADTYKPCLAELYPEKLNIYNLTTLKDTTNVLDGWLGSGVYTLTDSVSPESLKAVSVTSSYIYNQFYLEEGKLYKFEVTLKNNGSGTATVDLYDYALGSRKLQLTNSTSTYQTVTGYYRCTQSAKYNLLLRSSGTYCGIKVYNLDPKEF